MKGYGEFDWIKYLFATFVVIAVFILVEGSLGNIVIELTGSHEITKLKEWNVECNNRLDEKCNPCPIVQCTGDMTLPGFLIGLFFGTLFGIWFTLNFGKMFAEVFKKELSKVKQK